MKSLLTFLIILSLTLPAAAKDKLVIISPHWEGIRTEFTREFKNWYKNETDAEVEVTWLDQGGTSEDLRFIKSEFARTPNGIGVDLFYGGGIDPYLELAAKDLLEQFRVPEKILKKIPATLNGIPLYDLHYKWYGTSLAGFGILCNRKLIKKLKLQKVQDWISLTHPAFTGWVGSGDPRHSGSVHMAYEIILQAYGWKKGWEIILQIGGNVNTFPKSAAQTIKDLSTGEAACGFAIDTYAYSAIEEVGEENLEFIMPAKATVINPDSIAILKGAPNRRAAEGFIRFSLGERAQKIWMFRAGAPGGPKDFSLNKMSILPEIYKDARGKSIIRYNPFQGQKGLRYDFDKGTKRWGILNDLIGAFIIDTHSDLTTAWKSAARSKAKKGKFLAFPISENQAMQWAEKWDNSVFRNKKINEWLAMAKKKYKH
ncbi:MAG: ABC transporter substrate-binding protein [bacterium]